MESENINTNTEVSSESQDTFSIPMNSESLLVREETSRFSSAIWYGAVQNKTITLAGVGGIGSYTGFLLARLRPHLINIYDPDRVEAANMSGQLYGSQDLDETKVRALGNMISEYANYNNVLEFPERFTEESPATDIMICGFDNMAARRAFFKRWMRHVSSKPVEERGQCLFIDGRLAAEEYQVFAIMGSDTEAARKYGNIWLFSDSEADETVCSYKQTSFMAAMIASIIVNLFVNFVTGEAGDVLARPLPFLTSYDATTMYFKTEM